MKKYYGWAVTVIIPEQIHGLPVTAVENNFTGRRDDESSIVISI
jgi:hypothetical protein